MNLTDEQRLDIELAQADTHLTSRPISDGLEDFLYDAIPVLDEGFIRVVDYMGNDQSIVQAARVSYGTGTKHGSNDESLIRYLMRHWHTTPFEMCELKLHVKLPVFVARQWIRHRTASVNEYSARYSILDREFYVPELAQIQPQSGSNKQGREGGYDPDDAWQIQASLRQIAEEAFDEYEHLIAEDGHNTARELARTLLPLSAYTQWYWKVDLHNLLHFLRLRADPHAQYEIRVYAEAICKIAKAWVPFAYKAFEDYRLNAKSFSSQEMKFLQDLLSDDPNGHRALGDHHLSVIAPTYGLSKREAEEFVAKLKLPD